MFESRKFVHIVASIGVMAALLLSIAPAGASTQGASSVAHFQPWSGYAATGRVFTKVQGSVKVPKVTCTVNQAQVFFWVGFDGYLNPNVEQAGVGVQCKGKNLRTPSYFAWWEMATGSSNDAITKMPLKVAPGDLVTSTVTYAGSKFTMKVTNNSRKTSSSVAAKCANTRCARSSAEWIVERPIKNGAYVPLAKFGSVTLYGNMAAAGSNMKSISGFSHSSIIMVNASNKYLATPGSLSKNGESFVDTWEAAK